MGKIERLWLRLSVIGRRDRLSPDIAAAIERAEAATLAGRALHLRIGIDYSSRDAIIACHAASVFCAPTLNVWLNFPLDDCIDMLPTPL